MTDNNTALLNYYFLIVNSTTDHKFFLWLQLHWITIGGFFIIIEIFHFLCFLCNITDKTSRKTIGNHESELNQPFLIVSILYLTVWKDKNTLTHIFIYTKNTKKHKTLYIKQYFCIIEQKISIVNLFYGKYRMDNWLTQQIIPW